MVLVVGLRADVGATGGGLGVLPLGAVATTRAGLVAGSDTETAPGPEHPPAPPRVSRAIRIQDPRITTGLTV